MSTPENNTVAIAVLETKMDEHTTQCKLTNESNTTKFNKLFDELGKIREEAARNSKYIYMGIGILVALQFAAVVIIKFID